MCLAVPGKIVEIDSGDEMFPVAKAQFGGALKSVNLVYVPEARVGDYVLVHVGFAISLLREDQARKIFEELDRLEEP